MGWWQPLCRRCHNQAFLCPICLSTHLGWCISSVSFAGLPKCGKARRTQGKCLSRFVCVGGHTLGWLSVFESSSLPHADTSSFPQAVVYEAPGFQGQSWEVCRDIYNLQQPEDSQSPNLTSVGSLRVLGGW